MAKRLMVVYGDSYALMWLPRSMQLRDRSLEAHRLVQAILPCRVRNDRQPAILWYAEWPGHGMQSMAYLGTEPHQRHQAKPLGDNST